MLAKWVFVGTVAVLLAPKLAVIVFGPLLFPRGAEAGHPLAAFRQYAYDRYGDQPARPAAGCETLHGLRGRRVSIENVARPIFKYLAILAVALLIAFVPAITLALPRWLGVS